MNLLATLRLVRISGTLSSSTEQLVQQDPSQPAAADESLWKPAQVALLSFACLINLSGLFNPVQEPDSALYAGIARTMAQHGDYVNLMSMGRDWLDKPHLPFWIAAISFRFLGVSGFAYKLPAVLFLFLGARYTYLLGKDLSSRLTGFLAAFMLLSSEHIILSDSDVRAEPYLTAFLVAAVYYFRRSVVLVRARSQLVNLLLACIFTACAIMTKGVFIVVILAGGFLFEFLVSKNWPALLSWHWLIALVLTGVFIVPELYCLYEQFDLHPGKVIFGRTGVSGLRFFFWDSQFGRFTNSGPIKGSGEPLFFLHTLLWAFLPWPVLLIGAMRSTLNDCKNRVFLARVSRSGSFLCAGVSLAALLLFSASRFQLPHYTNIIFPFLSIICASYVTRLYDLSRVVPGKEEKVIALLQFAVAGLVIIALVVILWFERPPAASYWAMVIAAHAMLGVWLLSNRVMKTATGIMSTFVAGIAVLGVNLCLNLIVYPDILHYQAGSEAAFYINRVYPGVPFKQEGTYSYALSFYGEAPEIFSRGLIHSPVLIYTDAAGIKANGINGFKPAFSFPYYHTTKLSLQFLRKSTRDKVLETRAVIAR